MKKYIAEFIAAFFLVFAGTAAIAADYNLSVLLVRDTFGLLGIALAHGLALAAVIAAVGGISGAHGNPAVSLAFYIAKRMSVKELGGYVAAQLIGAAFASFMVGRVFVARAVDATGYGVPALGSGTTVLQGGLLEVVLTFFLAFVIWGVAVNPKGAKIIAPLAIGLTYSFGVIIGGPSTGGAMNPARWFGPALMSGQWGNWPVWILGPIVGALLASTVYELFFLEVTEEPGEDLEARAPEIVPDGDVSRQTTITPKDTGDAASAPAAESDA